MKHFLVATEGNGTTTITDVITGKDVESSLVNQVMGLAARIPSLPDNCYDAAEVFDDEDEFLHLCRHYDISGATPELFKSMLKARAGSNPHEAVFKWLAEKWGWNSKGVFQIQHDEPVKLKYPKGTKVVHLEKAGERIA